MATYVRKSILALFLVLLTAVAGTNFAKNVPAASHPALPALADQGGGDPVPPDPGPPSVHMA
jgi:hypothetical protein